MDESTIASYKKAGAIVAKAREHGASLVKPGVRYIDVAESVEAFIRESGGEPAFPCCISVDADAAHDTPAPLDTRVFQDGQVVKLDCGVQVDGYIGDTAITVEVGTTKYAEMQRAVKEALQAALDVVKPGVPIRHISSAIETTLTSFGVKPIANLTGHSVDQYHQHAGLSIPNVAATARGVIEAGTAIAIEPFGTDGAGRVKDSAGGHILHFFSAKPQRDPIARAALDHIQKRHPKLPFAARWLGEAIPANKIAYAVNVLQRSGCIREYPVLREAGNGQVCQFEHTVLVLDSGAVVTTLA